MRYEIAKNLSDKDFKRATGVERNTFQTMVGVIEEGLRKFGRPTTLSYQDQLLLTLMYWREYRTEFHIGLAYGVSEATVCRTIQKIELVLIKAKQFHLPGKKALQASEMTLEIVLLDATEQPIERPEKSNANTTVAKSGVRLKKHKFLQILY
jgi:hypothetical protein